MGPVVQKNSQCCPQTGTSPQSRNEPRQLSTEMESKCLKTVPVFDTAVKAKHIILYYTHIADHS